MEAGFLKEERTGGSMSRWMKGDPRRALFGGVKWPPWRERHSVGAFRCSKCGWLDLYAGPQFEAK